MKNKLGQIFGESITSGKKRPFRQFEEVADDFKSRLFFFQTILVILVGIIIVQLVRLTVIQGSYYSRLALGNRIKENLYPAPRGVILDRRGEVIVRNKPGFTTVVDCGEKKCYQKITHDEALKLEAKGVVTTSALGVSREYSDPQAFSHILGITGNVSPEEIDKNHCGKKLNYEDVLGRSGVEKAFDCLLQGISGKTLLEVDALGNPVKTLSKKDPLPGKSLTLSIDKKLQLKAKELLADKKGVIIAHIPQTGEILVLYSSPSYDLSKFVQGYSQTEYNRLVNDPVKPLFNRAIAGIYPPGSTFKPVIASAALEEKIIDQNTEIEDTGVINVGSYSYSNWYFTQYGGKEGLVNVVKALTRSNDIFFYKVGEMLGINKIAAWASKFKFGQKLGIEIDGEETGIVPDEKWKEKTKGEQWFLGDTYHVAIGQGNLLTTPLQIAFAFGAFANNGIICRPTLLKTTACSKITDKLVSAKNLNLIKEGLIGVCQQGGTAYPFFGFKVGEREIKVACKTGTAEFGDPQNKTHAWFTAFAPLDNPQLAVTVLVEEGGEGSGVAAPIAKTIFEEWFKM